MVVLDDFKDYAMPLVDLQRLLDWYPLWVEVKGDLYPCWPRSTSSPPIPIQRIGIGAPTFTVRS